MSSLPTSSTTSPSSSAHTPITRSRTLLFISYRDSSARVPRTSRIGRQYEDSYHLGDENEGLINHQGTPHTSIDVELPPKWYVRSEKFIFPNISHSFLNQKKNMTGWTTLNK
jgi:syntaxin 16